MADGVLIYAGFLQVLIKYEQEKNVWMASHNDYPSFSAYAKTKGTSLALGIQTWHIFNDSKGGCFKCTLNTTKYKFFND